MTGHSLIYCDGACSGNPGPGGWGAITLDSSGNVRELGGSSAHTTNNQMELTATIEALKFLKAEPAPVILYTDSKYVIQGITEWIFGWMRRGWLTAEGKPVSNQPLWESLLDVVKARPASGKIDWRYVPGHAGIAGNERVDSIAVDFSKGITPVLYRGAASSYFFDLTELPPVIAASKSKPGQPKDKEASLYVSLVGKVAVKHATWKECEARVRGVSGAKYQKGKSPAEIDSILVGWGVDPKSAK